MKTNNSCPPFVQSLFGETIMQLLKIMLSKNLGTPVWNCIPTTRMHIKDGKDIFQKVKTLFLSCRIAGSFSF